MNYTKQDPASILIADRSTYDGSQPIYGPLPDSAGREEVRLSTAPKPFVVVTLGQSNAANFGRGPYEAGPQIANFSLYDGKLYRARDPLIGASGDGANFATRLGDLLVKRGFHRQIIIAPIAMGNTRIEAWSPGGEFNRRILVLIRRLSDAGLTPDVILWQHGEGNACDHDPGGRSYRRHLCEIIQTFRIYDINAPFMVALCSRCGPPHPNAECVRTAQLTIVNSSAGILGGPDTDLIGDEDRFDCCHMAESGICKQAEMWADAIISKLGLKHNYFRSDI